MIAFFEFMLMTEGFCCMSLTTADAVGATFRSCLEENDGAAAMAGDDGDSS